EQHEDGADRHQRRLGRDAGNRELAQILTRALTEQALTDTLNGVVRDQKSARDRDDLDRDLDRVLAIYVIGAEQPREHEEQTAAHAAEVEDVAELGPPALDLVLEAPSIGEP